MSSRDASSDGGAPAAWPPTVAATSEGNEPLVVRWRPGDQWRDLTDEAKDGGATIISLSGTTRLVVWDAARGAWHARLPLEGGHVLAGDGAFRRLETLRVTPCGVSLTEPDGAWSASTPLRLLLRGVRPGWVAGPTGRAIIRDVIDRVPPLLAPGHPAQPCGAFYCPVARRHRGAARDRRVD